MNGLLGHDCVLSLDTCNRHVVPSLYGDSKIYVILISVLSFCSIISNLLNKSLWGRAERRDLKGD